MPGGLELDEVGEAMLVVQRAEGKIVENLDVGAVGVAALDVLDKRDLFEDILVSSRLCRRRLMMASVSVSPWRNSRRAGIAKSLLISRVMPARAVRV